MPELRGIEVPQLMRIKLPEAETAALSRIQRNLDDLARHARTFTAAAEMLSFARQRAEAHEVKFDRDNSALGQERRNLLSEWQMIAVREGAMTLFHVAAAMSEIAHALQGCPTMSASIDQARMDQAGQKFRQSFPGFKPLGGATDQPPAPPHPQPRSISFSQAYTADHVRIHAEKNNVFQIGDSRKYIGRAPGSDDPLSYALDSASVYELRGIVTTYLAVFSEVASQIAPKWPSEVG